MVVGENIAVIFIMPIPGEGSEIAATALNQTYIRLVGVVEVAILQRS